MNALRQEPRHSESRSVSRYARALAPALGYIAAAAAFTWPLPLRMSSHLGALQGAGDPYLNLWILGWDLHVLSSNPAALFTGKIFDANIFHPARQVLAYSDHLTLQAIASWPLFALTESIVLCYNAVLLASFILSALAMYAFAREVTGSRAAAWIAGLAWGFWPYRFAHLIHIQLQALYFMPLTFLFLYRLATRHRRRDAAFLGVTTGLQAIASLYYGIIGGIGLLAAACGALLGGARMPVRVAVPRFALATIIAAALFLPFAVPYWQVQQREGFARTLEESARHAPAMRSYLSVPPTNRAYGRTGLLVPSAGPERELFPGFTLIALAAAGVLVAWRQRQRPLLAATLVGVTLAFVLSLGPEGVNAVYAGFYRWVPGFDAIRAPARFSILVVFGLVTLAAIAVSQRAAAVRSRSILGWSVAAMSVLLAGEYFSAPMAFVSAPPSHTPLGAWLKSAPEPGAVVFLPLTLDADSTPMMVQSLEHKRPTVNGYSGQRPGFYNSLAATLAPFPSAAAIWALQDLGVRYIVTSTPVDEGEWPIEKRVTTTGAGPYLSAPAVVYELMPSEVARIALPEPPEPPAPGPFPFEVGEQIEYDVFWKGGGTSVPAGRVTIQTEAAPDTEAQSRSPGTPAMTFRLSAAPAEWASWFFNADATFETVVDERLLPLRHKRRVGASRRVAVYDHETPQVRFGPEDQLMSLPILRSSRDPLTTFFYLRTLTLDAGASVRVPVTDQGRNMLVDLPAAKLESITHGGRTVETLRIEPTIRRTIERRRPLRIVLWMARDRRRLPLVAEVDAPFGAFRIELRNVRGSGATVGR